MASARSSTAASRSRARTATRARTVIGAPRRVSGPRRVSRRTTRARVRWDRVGRVALVVVLIIVAGLYVEHALSYLAVRSQADHQCAVVRGLERDNATLARQASALRAPATIGLDARR